MPVTYTHATTYTRIDLVKIQFRVALRRTTSISKQVLEKLMIGIDNKWIEKVSVYGMNSQNLCRAQLIIEIDWNEYDTHLSRGRGTVAIDEKWTDNTAIELDEAIKLFDDFVKRYALATNWQATYTPIVNQSSSMRTYVLNTLGHIDAVPVKWAGSQQGLMMNIRELSEISVGFFGV